MSRRIEAAGEAARPGLEAVERPQLVEGLQHRGRLEGARGVDVVHRAAADAAQARQRALGIRAAAQLRAEIFARVGGIQANIAWRAH